MPVPYAFRHEGNIASRKLLLLSSVAMETQYPLSNLSKRNNTMDIVYLNRKIFSPLYGPLVLTGSWHHKHALAVCESEYEIA